MLLRATMTTKQKVNIFVLSGIMILFTAGCATMQSRWQDAVAINTIAAYEKFLKLYSTGTLADEARSRLETLYLQKAKDTNTIAAYEDFLKRYTKGPLADNASLYLKNLKNQLKAVEQAARDVLPPEAKVEVTSVSRYPQKSDFVISAHLLEGHSTDDNSPYVRGDYGTHEKLTNLIRYRCAKVLKSIFSGTNFPNAGKIIIKARHGVRQSYFSGGFGGTDIAMTIYEVSISLDRIKEYNWAQIQLEKVMELWSVEQNIIPKLQFHWQFK